MNRKIKILRQLYSDEDRRSPTTCIFGKQFNLDAVSEEFRIVLHADFPLIREKDLEDFILYSLKIKKVVISGCKVKVHPYRLIYIDEKGYGNHLVDIPQSIRGNRHLYPEIYQFVPAIISIPPSLPIDNFNEKSDLDIYIMPTSKLLDRSLLVEKMLIASINESS